MSKIRFENGKVVNFDGIPTPQDIDYVASTLGIKKDTQQNTNNPSFPYVPADGGIEDIKNAARLAGNVPSSVVQGVKNIGSALVNVANPNPDENTLLNIGRVGVGALESIPGAEKVVNPQTPEEKLAFDKNRATASAAWQYLVDRYGGVQNVKKSMVEDPAGVLFDVASLLEGGGTVLKSSKLAEAGRAINPIRVATEAAKLPNISKATTPEEAQAAAGKVLQAEKSAQPTGVKVLESIDTTGVQTYDDLAAKLDDVLKSDKVAVDSEYAKVQTQTKLKDLAQSKEVKVGNKTAVAKSNYVKDALSNLEELYKSTNQADEAVRIKLLRSKAIQEGLTPSEINGLAREYGTEFGEKAFNPRTGEAKTSVSAEAFENTRKGIKDTARSFLADDSAKALDKKISETLDVKRNVEKMSEAVNKLEQKVNKRTIPERIARTAAVGIQYLTMGTLKAFFQKLLLESNVGLKQMNSLALQEQLAKNLKIIRSLNNATGSTFVSKMARLLRENKELLQSIPVETSKVLRVNTMQED